MITRGYFIGQIIDELTAVSQQVKSRAGLQLFDLNRYLEDFFKDILNIVYGYKLINLNEERSNNPGLDLGDEVAKVAFQVTSTKSSSKVNETLKKAAKQVGKFPKIFVLVLQDKQSSYTLDPALAKPFSFVAEEHVLDIGDVLMKVLSLPIEQLQSLHDLVSKEVAIKPYIESARIAKEGGIGINAGHDLDLHNLKFLKQNIPFLDEVSIGHALICDALYLGLENTIQLYLKQLK